jgi:hypothetical protein
MYFILIRKSKKALLMTGLLFIGGLGLTLLCNGYLGARHLSIFPFFMFYILHTQSEYRINFNMKYIGLLPLTFVLFITPIIWGADNVMNKYSPAEDIANFLTDNGYDNENVLIIVSDAELFSVELANMKYIKTVRTYFNGIPYDVSYNPYQVDGAFQVSFEGKNMTVDFLQDEYRMHQNDYSAILYIEMDRWNKSEVNLPYKIIYKTQGYTVRSEESVTIYLLDGQDDVS